MAEAAAAAVILCPAPRRSTAARKDSVPNRFDKNGIISGILNEVGELDIKSSAGFYCGSPPCRPTNPMVEDPRFHEVNSGVSPCNSSVFKCLPSPSRSSGSCLITKAEPKQPAVRIEGFDSFNRQRRQGCSITMLA